MASIILTISLMKEVLTSYAVITYCISGTKKFCIQSFFLVCIIWKCRIFSSLEVYLVTMM